MIKNLTLKAAVAAVALACSATAMAGNLVQIDFSGTGNPGTSVIADSLNYQAGNLLFQGLFPIATTGSGVTPINILGHGTATFQFAGTSVVPAGKEITYVFGVPAFADRIVTGPPLDFIEHITLAGGGYFKVYLDDNDAGATNGTVKALPITGAGFEDGTLLFSGKFNPQTMAQLLTLTSGGTALTNLDQFAGDGFVNVLTEIAGGSPVYSIDITTQNNNYILNNISTFAVGNADESYATSSLTPFNGVDPSTGPSAFRNVTDTGDVAVNYGNDVGPGVNPGGLPVNNNQCGTTGPCDLHTQSTGAGSFQASDPIPEPATLALMGLGLGMLGFGSKRRRKTA